MNYLGHLYFSNNNLDLMYANIFGDFIKGSDLSNHPKYVQHGIRLHRSIDNYIDTHAAVKDLMQKLYKPLPKISGIAVDLYFDHILAQRWNEFHPKELTVFLDDFYSYNFNKTDFENDPFHLVIEQMKEFKWLSHYHSFEGLTKASQSLSRRISFDNKLDYAPEVFVSLEKEINLAFDKYMNDAIPYFQEYFNKM